MYSPELLLKLSVAAVRPPVRPSSASHADRHDPEFSEERRDRWLWPAYGVVRRRTAGARADAARTPATTDVTLASGSSS